MQVSDSHSHVPKADTNKAFFKFQGQEPVLINALQVP